MAFWWWWGGVKKKAAPAPLNLPTTTPVSWSLGTPGKQMFRFGPGGCCGCLNWTDTFQREAMGAGWEQIAGTGWTTGAGVGLTATNDGTLISTRATRQACHPLPAIRLSINGTMTAFRVYYDWVDAANHSYAEVTTADDLDPDGGMYGKGTLAMYSVTDGAAPGLLAGPEECWPFSYAEPTTLTVQFATTVEPGEYYVQALCAEGWVSCLAQFRGNRFGFGVSGVGGTGQPVISQFRQADCFRTVLNKCADHLADNLAL